MIRRLAVAVSLCFAFITNSAHSQVPTRLPVVRVEHDPNSEPPGIWSDSARRVVLDSLQVGRQRWNRRRPAEYLYAAYTSGGMIAIESIGDSYFGWLVRRDSLIRRITIHPATFDKWREWFAMTIDSSFAIVEHAARDRTYQVDALELDPEYGFPRTWHVDDVHNGHGRMYVTDRGYGGHVEVFSADPRAWRCSWWRRLLRRCP